MLGDSCSQQYEEEPKDIGGADIAVFAGVTLM